MKSLMESIKRRSPSKSPDEQKRGGFLSSSLTRRSMSRISSPTLPSAPVSFPSPSDFECVVCLCDYPTSQIHLTCEHQHGVCASCFLSFVQINCTERTLPLLCPLKECSVLLPDASIAAILGSLGDAEALAAFEQASVYACLAEEKAIICPVCNQYAVLYEAPDDEFWKRVLKRQDAKVNTERSEITEQLEITLRNLENDFARQLDQILSNKASTISIVRNKHHRDLEQKCEQILETQEKERGDFFLEEKVVVPAFLSAAEIREMHQLSIEERFQALTDAYASCREHFARSENPREQARKAELSRIRVAFAEEFASKIAADVSEIEARFSIEIEQFYERKKQTIEATLKPLQEKLERLSRRDPEEWRSIAASLRKDDMDSKSIDSKSVASSKLPPAHKTWFKWRKQKSPSSPGSSPSFIVESSTGSELQISSSIKFFVCERLGCDGAFCVSCMKPTTKQSLSDHICSLNELDVLHEQILDVLAKASSRKCPNCGFSGIKDLACTHITCSRCSIRWCYVCGVAESDLPGGFSTHNEWYLDTPPDDKKCPMYLHFKYGDELEGSRRGGDPARSLAAFHIELQRNAILELESKTNPDLWDRIIQERFSNGFGI